MQKIIEGFDILSKQEKRSSFLSFILFFVAAFAVFPVQGQKSEKIVLFDGTDLSEWHIQGPSELTIVDDVMVATKASNAWSHIISHKRFGDAYIRLQYKIDLKNSGLYVRGDSVGRLGAGGMQFEMGAKRDGSAMLISKSGDSWMPDNPVFTSGAAMKEWHEMVIETNGRGYTSYIDGKKITEASDLPLSIYADSGVLVLQMHGQSPAKNYYKNIEVFVPTKITGCADQSYDEYDSLVNDPDSNACLRKSVSLSHQTHQESTFLNPVISYRTLFDFVKRNPTLKIFTIDGKEILPKELILKQTGSLSSLFIISVDEKNRQRIFVY